jgi:hypothetical protein
MYRLLSIVIGISLLVGLLIITGSAGASNAPDPDSRPQGLKIDNRLASANPFTLTSQAYLPIIRLLGCTSYKATVYASSDMPVVEVDLPFTVTTVLVNDGCAGLGKLSYSVTIASDEGIVAQQRFSTLSAYIRSGQYDVRWFGFAITQTNQFTVTPAVSFEADYGGVFGWGTASSMPFVIRVLPNLVDAEYARPEQRQ